MRTCMLFGFYFLSLNEWVLMNIQWIFVATIHGWIGCAGNDGSAGLDGVSEVQVLRPNGLSIPRERIGSMHTSNDYMGGVEPMIVAVLLRDIMASTPQLTNREQKHKRHKKDAATTDMSSFSWILRRTGRVMEQAA